MRIFKCDIKKVPLLKRFDADKAKKVAYWVNVTVNFQYCFQLMKLQYYLIVGARA